MVLVQMLFHRVPRLDFFRTGPAPAVLMKGPVVFHVPREIRLLTLGKLAPTSTAFNGGHNLTHAVSAVVATLVDMFCSHVTLKLNRPVESPPWPTIFFTMSAIVGENTFYIVMPSHGTVIGCVLFYCLLVWCFKLHATDTNKSSLIVQSQVVSAK